MGTRHVPDIRPSSRVLSRRTLLRRTGLGLATVAVLGAGVFSYRAYDQGVLETGEGPAYEPWRSWQHGDGLLPLVRAAVLAPSPHNAQAWLFAIADGHIDVFADPGRRIGAIDPFDRELHIGIGAALENLVLAARAEGWAPSVELLPTADPTHLARVALARSRPRVSSLYRQIPRRHTDRHAFVVDRPVDPGLLDAMSALALPGVGVVWVTDPVERDAVGELLVAATREIVGDAAQLASDHRWFRHGWDEIQHRRDGVTLDAAGLSTLVTAIAKVLPAQSPTALGDAWLDATIERHTATAAAYGVVVVEDPSDVAARIRGGRTLQRIHLWASGAGLGLHHMNQITERSDREVELAIASRFGSAMAEHVPVGTRALSTFRIGHPTEPATPSPRRSAEQVIVG